MKRVLRYVGRFFASLGAILVLALGLTIGAILIVCLGPSQTASNLFVNSALESSVGKVVVPMIIGEKKLKEITALNEVEQTTEITDTDLIVIPTAPSEGEEPTEQPVEPIEFVHIKGEAYNGIVALVHDPTRVSIGISGKFGPEYAGKTVKAIAEKENAILAVNGGGFSDPGGHGNGGTPDGIVIHDGELVWGSLDKKYEVIGFDKDSKMVLGVMTGQEALDKGVMSALSFGPFLIVNGKPANVSGSGSGLNPRTAIGQCADGTVVIVAVDGRQPNSLGATMSDLIEIMTNFGAVNAANLDGGSSTVMYYDGEYINHYTSLYGPRPVPTCVIVK